MAVRPAALEKPQTAASEAVSATHALALCAVAYYLYSLSRVLAARTAEVLLDAAGRLASSPLEAAILTTVALWFVSWSLDRHSKAAQLLSTLNVKLLSAAILQSAQQQQQAATDAATGNSCGGGKVRVGNSPRKLGPPVAPSPGGSPGKDVSSYRLPDPSYSKAGGARGQQQAAPGQQQKQQRWSMDAAPPGSSSAEERRQVAIQPKPRTSVDFDAVAAAAPTKSPPARRSPGQHHRLSRRSAADHNAAPMLGAAVDEPSAPGKAAAAAGGGDAGSQQRQDKWQPRMQRIASGQQLADLAARGSMDSTCSGASSSGSIAAAAEAPNLVPAAAASMSATAVAALAAAAAASMQSDPCSLAATVSASTAAAAAPAALSSWLPTTYLTWAPFANSGLLLPGADGGGAAASPDAALTAAAAAAVGQWVASTSTACAAWASSTVDTVLRPLIPGSRPLDALMWRSGSAPLLLGAAAPSQEQEEGLAGSGSGMQQAASLPLAATAVAAAMLRASSSAAAAANVDHSFNDRRRQSFDGVSARHYTQGGVTADPNRKQALENYAVAARMQCGSSLGLGGSGSHHTPGHLAAVISDFDGGSSSGGGGTPLGPDAGSSALASIGLDGDCPQEIREHVTDEHLLQFAAVAGEEASRTAAAELVLPPAWGAGSCLMGVCDAAGAGCSEERWEQVVERSEGDLTYEVWRQPLRGGLYMYRTRTTFRGVSCKDLRPFHLDDHARHLWDENVIEIRRVKPAGAPRLHKHSEWCLHQYRSRFPRPMAAREYQYARRVWHRPSDGGCYVLCRGRSLPEAGDGYRAVKVTDMVSGCVIRATPGGAEMTSLYFEDSLVRAGLAKMAVKGMWGYMQKYDSALRVFAEARQAASVQFASVGGGIAAARRRSLDGPRRRQLLLQRVGEDVDGEDEDEAGASSGDDALQSAYAAMRHRLRRAAGGSRLAATGRGGGDGAGADGRARWAGRLVVLAGIKMVHAMLAARR